jgi:hypothetical protein
LLRIDSHCECTILEAESLLDVFNVKQILVVSA